METIIEKHERRGLFNFNFKFRFNFIKPDEPPSKPSGYISSITINHIKIKGIIMALSMKDTDQGVADVVFTDKKGSNLPVGNSITPGSSVLEIQDQSIGTGTFDEATQKLTVVAGTAGVTQGTLKAKDLDGADFQLPDFAIEVIPGDAVGGAIGEFTVSPQV